MSCCRGTGCRPKPVRRPSTQQPDPATQARALPTRNHAAANPASAVSAAIAVGVPDWVGKGGRAVKLSGAALTASEHLVGAVVCVQAKGMKEPWCLATSLSDATSREIVDAYARRWTVEPSFRDTNDIRFGMGLSLLRISRQDRRDRLLLLNAFATHLLTMLGTAGEELGMDRHLRSGTSKRRTHSLFRQGCMLYDLIPNMPEVRLRPLMQRFAEVMQRSSAIQALVAVP